MGYLLAALLGGFFLFNGAATPDKAADMAQKALQKQYPTSKVNVEMEGKRGMSVLKGNFKRVHIDLADIVLSDLPFSTERVEKPKIGRAGKLEVELKNLTWGTLPVERARFDFENVEYDFNALKKKSEFQIVGMTAGQMQLRLSTQSLRPAFAEKLADIENVAISLEGDQFTLTGQRDVVGLKAPIVLKARLAGVENTLRLEEPTLTLSGVKLPDLATKRLIADVNPIYAFDKDGKWPFRVQLTEVAGKDDFLDMKADLSLKAR
jgi:hypothetical protein